MKATKDRVHRIQEYNCAAAVLAAGGQLIGAEPGRRVSLVFDDSDGVASRLVAQHRDGELMLSTLKFAQALAEIKTTIFSTRD